VAQHQWGLALRGRAAIRTPAASGWRRRPTIPRCMGLTVGIYDRLTLIKPAVRRGHDVLRHRRIADGRDLSDGISADPQFLRVVEPLVSHFGCLALTNGPHRDRPASEPDAISSGHAHGFLQGMCRLNDRLRERREPTTG
jgi:hypothetical protein